MTDPAHAVDPAEVVRTATELLDEAIGVAGTPGNEPHLLGCCIAVASAVSALRDVLGATDDPDTLARAEDGFRRGMTALVNIDEQLKRHTSEHGN